MLYLQYGFMVTYQRAGKNRQRFLANIKWPCNPVPHLVMETTLAQWQVQRCRTTGGIMPPRSAEQDPSLVVASQIRARHCVGKDVYSRSRIAADSVWDATRPWLTSLRRIRYIEQAPGSLTLPGTRTLPNPERRKPTEVVPVPLLLHRYASSNLPDQPRVSDRKGD